MAFGTGAVQLFESLRPPLPAWHDDVPYHGKTLMDDTILVEPCIGLRPRLSMAWAEQCLRLVFGPEAINEKKKGLEGTFATKQIVWGIEYDTELETVAYPELKVMKLRLIAGDPELDGGCRRVSVHQVQVLCGTLQSATVACPALGPEMGALYQMLAASEDGEANVRPKGTREEQERAWQEWWEAIAAIRVFVEVPELWSQHFTTGLRAMLTLPEQLALPGAGERVLWAGGDSTLEVIGAADWEAKVYGRVLVSDVVPPSRNWPENRRRG